MKRIKVFTGNCLDSAGSLMIIKWAFGETCKIDHTVSNIFNIKRDYEHFAYGKYYTDYDHVFILNMVPDFEIEDADFVFSKWENEKSAFKGKVAVSTSTTKLMRAVFAKKLPKLSDAQIKLLDTINTFYTDGVTKKESMKLNAIFQYGRNKYSAFYERFINGLTDYTDDELQIIKHYTVKLSKTYKDVEIYEHSSKKGAYIALVDDMTHKHEILDLLFKKHKCNIMFLVDLEDGFISVRKDDSLEMDMHTLCNELICGRALKNCAGGRFTEKFLDFSKAFM